MSLDVQNVVNKVIDVPSWLSHI